MRLRRESSQLRALYTHSSLRSKSLELLWVVKELAKGKTENCDLKLACANVIGSKQRRNLSFYISFALSSTEYCFNYLEQTKFFYLTRFPRTSNSLEINCFSKFFELWRSVINPENWILNLLIIDLGVIVCQKNIFISKNVKIRKFWLLSANCKWRLPYSIFKVNTHGWGTCNIKRWDTRRNFYL